MNHNFTCRYPSLLPFSSLVDVNKLGEEFIEYQLLQLSDIPESVWESSIVHVIEEARHHRMDVVWGYMSEMKNADGTARFPRLSKVAQLALILPHSNAEEERVFSLDWTLSSIVAVKLANPEPCIKFEPPPNIIAMARKATMNYN